MKLTASFQEWRCTGHRKVEPGSLTKVVRENSAITDSSDSDDLSRYGPPPTPGTPRPSPRAAPRPMTSIPKRRVTRSRSKRSGHPSRSRTPERTPTNLPRSQWTPSEGTWPGQENTHRSSHELSSSEAARRTNKRHNEGRTHWAEETSREEKLWTFQTDDSNPKYHSGFSNWNYNLRGSHNDYVWIIKDRTDRNRSQSSRETQARCNTNQ